jgi:hypothetical protein
MIIPEQVYVLLDLIDRAEYKLLILRSHRSLSRKAIRCPPTAARQSGG